MADAETPEDGLEPTRVEPGVRRASEQPSQSTTALREQSGFVRDLTPTEGMASADSSVELPPELPPGTSIDHYRVMRLLGRGGMGEVYVARDTKLGRKVALKIVLPHVLRSQGEKERFFFEARATAALNHPHIVTIYGTGEFMDRPYVALEYLEGQNLRVRARERALSLPETLRFGRAIALALAHAHENGILHRDLKPANVVIARDGRIRVVDFGLAKVVEDDVADEDGPSFIPGLTQLQQSGEDTWTAGTPTYMAPEQWRGESGGTATDVWALGVMLFELIAGEKPFDGDSSPMLAAAVCDKQPAPRLPLDDPRELVELVARCLDKKAAGRPSADEVAAVLAELLAASAKAQLDVEPFRGLLPFAEGHAADFNGRESEVAAFVERVRLQPILPVVGPSGAGKSSLVRAGVLPRLREQGRWRVVDVRPQARPFRALAGALVAARGSARRAGESVEELAASLRARPAQLSLELRALAQDAHVLLFVDQLEEIFTLASPVLARLFLEALWRGADDAVDPVRIVFTLRQDFLDRIAMVPELSAALGNIFVVHRPGAKTLRRILEQPIEARGYRYEDDEMVTDMVTAVVDSPACLPLLSFAARQLWDERDRERKLLLRSAFDAMGGVEGALASHADGVLGGFGRRERRLARELLLRLVTSERTRKVVPAAQALEGLEGGEQVLARLTDARLVNVVEGDGDSELELAHESLLQTWRTLGRWLDESRDDLAFREEVRQAAELWDRRGRRDDEVWRSSALADAERALERWREPPALIRAFLRRGRRLEDRRRVRRRAVVTVAFVALAVVAVVLALQKREADALRNDAELRERQSESRRAEALREGVRAALGEGRLLEARAKLRSALEIEDAPAARALWWQLGREPALWHAPLPATVYAVDFAPDGAHVAAACQDGAVYLIDVVDRRERVLRGHDDQVLAVAFAPDGASLASGGYDGSLRSWGVDGRSRWKIDTGTGVWQVAYSPDGQTIASAGADGVVRLWSATGAAIGELTGHTSDVFGVRFSTDSRQIVTGSFDGTVRVWRDGKAEHVLRGHEGRVFEVAFSPDGKEIFSAGHDGTVRRWTLADGSVAVIRDDSGLFGIELSTDGRTLYTSNVAGEVRAWDSASGRRLRTLGSHDAAALAIAKSPDGSLLASGGDDRAVHLWREARAMPAKGGEAHIAGVSHVAVAPDGERIASAGHDGTIRLWDRDGRVLRVLAGHDATLRTIAFSPDGSRLASAGHDRTVRLWNLERGTVERMLAGHREPVFGLAFSPDGERLVTASRDHSVRVWDTVAGLEIARFDDSREASLAAAWSPDGRWLAAAGGDRVLRTWDAETLELTGAYRHHEDAVLGLAFSPDGAAIASGGEDRAVRIVDLASGSERLVGRQAGRIYWLAFHPSGDIIAAPDSSGQIVIWDRDGQQLAIARGHRNEVNAVAFAPDGSWAVSASDDGTVRTWTVASWRALWRAPVLVGGHLLAHTGWLELGAGGDGVARPGTPPAGWSAALAAAAETRADRVVVAGEIACLADGDTLELWRLSGAAPSERRPVVGLSALIATDDGCVALGEQAWRGSAAGLKAIPEVRPVAIGRALGGALVATATDVVTPRGDRIAVGPGIVALHETAAGIVVGYRDGHLELVGGDVAFEDTPHAQPTALATGPGDTIVVGYSDGSVGMWPSRGGPRLAAARLHGAVVHVAVAGTQMHLASDLGRHLTWHLEAFHQDACAVLRDVWRDVPVVWEGGRPVARATPAEHRCHP